MRHNLIDRLKEEWAQLDPVDPLRGLIADAIDALAKAQQQEPPNVPPARASKPWMGLTDEEIKHEWVVWRASIPRYMGFSKGIEAKLREKNA